MARFRVSYDKRPAEILTLTHDFSAWLSDGETLDTPTVTSTDQSGADSSATIVDSYSVSGSILTYKVKAGSDGDIHTVLLSTTTSAGNLLQDLVTLKVAA